MRDSLGQFRLQASSCADSIETLNEALELAILNNFDIQLNRYDRLIKETDLSYPIILSSDGRVMDGMHRVAKALLGGQETIEAVQFSQDPEPDYIDVLPDDLPY